MPVTIYDISREAGVSIATVSRVLNGSELVSEKTRRRVMEVIERRGFTPNVFARGLGLNTMNTVGLLCANINDPPIARAVFYLQRFFRRQGYATMLLCTEDDIDTRRKSVEQLLCKRVDAIVLCGSHFVEQEDARNDYLRAAAQTVPVVLLIGALDAPGLYSILPDDRFNEAEAVGVLLDAGARRVMHLYHSRSYAGKRKLDGWRDAHERRGLVPDERLIVGVPEHPEPEQQLLAAEKVLRDAAASGVNFDAVAASNDSLAVAALRYAHARGLSVPDELQIIGFDATTLSLCTTPTLSTVDTRLDAVCSACVDAVMSVLSGTPPAPFQLFPGRLLLRASTRGAAPAPRQEGHRPS